MNLGRGATHLKAHQKRPPKPCQGQSFRSGSSTVKPNLSSSIQKSQFNRFTSFPIRSKRASRRTTDCSRFRTKEACGLKATRSQQASSSSHQKHQLRLRLHLRLHQPAPTELQLQNDCSAKISRSIRAFRFICRRRPVSTSACRQLHKSAVSSIVSHRRPDRSPEAPTHRSRNGSCRAINLRKRLRSESSVKARRKTEMVRKAPIDDHTHV